MPAAPLLRFAYGSATKQGGEPEPRGTSMSRSGESGVSAGISSRQIIPLPQAEDYLVRRRRKEQQEEQVRQETVEYTWEDYE